MSYLSDELRLRNKVGRMSKRRINPKGHNRQEVVERHDQLCSQGTRHTKGEDILGISLWPTG